MQTCRLTAVAVALTLVCAAAAGAQDNDEAPGITARVRATFVDEAGGLGVLSGDLSIVRFEVRSGSLMAIARIVGAMADSTGKVLGPVTEELAVGVSNVDSTCNQVRMELAAIDVDVLERRVHFDGQTAGFDSRDGTTPKALGVMCAAGELLRSKPAPTALARALDNIAIAVKAPK